MPLLPSWGRPWRVYVYLGELNVVESNHNSYFFTLQDGMQQRRGSHDNQQVGVGLSSNPRSGVVYRHNLAPHHQSRPPRRGVSVPDLVINNKDKYRAQSMVINNKDKQSTIDGK